MDPSQDLQPFEPDIPFSKLVCCRQTSDERVTSPEHGKQIRQNVSRDDLCSCTLLVLMEIQHELNLRIDEVIVTEVHVEQLVPH